jgi:hypothetical protein
MPKMVNQEVVDDAVYMVYEGLFPSIDFGADVTLRYDGTVPAKVEVAEIGSDNVTLQTLWALGEATVDEPRRYGIWVAGYKTVEEGVDITDEFIPYAIGEQLHNGDEVNITLYIHLPQDDDFWVGGALYEFQDFACPLSQANLMGLSDLTFTGEITVIQWNEFDGGA